MSHALPTRLRKRELAAPRVRVVDHLQPALALAASSLRCRIATEMLRKRARYIILLLWMYRATTYVVATPFLTNPI